LNVSELLHHLDSAEDHAGLSQLPAQQIENHQGEDAVEGVHAQLLVGPVEGGRKLR
jgi:hypothetical protein